MAEQTLFDKHLSKALFGPNRVLNGATPVVFFLGATYAFYRASRLVYKSLSFLYRHFCRRQLDLYARYGSKDKKSWAVVTGGSDGYGLDICHKLAAQGFNICIIARNEEKMK